MLGCCAKWTDPMRESVTDLAAGWQALLSLPAARAAGAAAATARPATVTEWSRMTQAEGAIDEGGHPTQSLSIKD